MTAIIEIGLLIVLPVLSYIMGYHFGKAAGIQETWTLVELFLGGKH